MGLDVKSNNFKTHLPQRWVSPPHWPFVEMNQKLGQWFAFHGTRGAILYFGRTWSEHGQWTHIHVGTRMPQFIFLFSFFLFFMVCLTYYLHEDRFGTSIAYFCSTTSMCARILSPSIPFWLTKWYPPKGFLIFYVSSAEHMVVPKFPAIWNFKESNARMEGGKLS